MQEKSYHTISKSYTVYFEKFFETLCFSVFLCYNEDMEKKFYRHKFANLINVQKMVTVYYQELPAGYASEEEHHDFWEMIYADKHSTQVILCGVTHTLKQGEAVFIKPNIPHYVRCLEDANLFIISFECHSQSMSLFEEQILEVPQEQRHLLQTIMTEATQTFNLPDFNPTLNKLELLLTPNLGGEQMIKNTLEILFIYLLRRENERTSIYFFSEIENTRDLKKAILEYLSKHLYEKFSLDALSEELHYSRTRLCNVFKTQTGGSIYSAYMSMKINEAKGLIRKKLPIAEVAERLGFSSSSHFISTFKKHTGATPREYADSVKR